MATKAQLEGNKRHQEKLDRIVFYLEKGGKEKLKAHAIELGHSSINAYLAALIKADMGKLSEE